MRRIQLYLYLISSGLLLATYINLSCLIVVLINKGLGRCADPIELSLELKHDLLKATERLAVLEGQYQPKVKVSSRSISIKQCN